jgi:adenylyl- and sulfurtransferase ThiI
MIDFTMHRTKVICNLDKPAFFKKCLMTKMIQRVLLGMAILLLVNGMWLGPAHSQTLDSLYVTTDVDNEDAARTIHPVIPLPGGQILVGGCYA